MMTYLGRPLFLGVLYAAALFAIGQNQAAAQLPSMSSGGSVRPSDANTDAYFAPQAKPQALPGARSGSRGPAVVPEKGAADLAPTEALFDAINRGDMASARDAVSRGAQLDARNILGLTPVDLAIDLGRNDMTFMLLSMRGATGGAAPPSANAAPVREAPVRATPIRSAPVRDEIIKPAPVARRQNSAAADGTPVPSAGFLGFGSPGR